MIGERVPIETTPRGGFIYVIHFDDANCVMIGLGHASANGLQVTHAPGVAVHGGYIHEIADAIEAQGFEAATGRLAPFFDGAEKVAFTDGAERIRKGIADALRSVHDEVWGHPHDWEPAFVDLFDGRYIWVAYDDGIEKIRIGIGFISEANERVPGDASYAIAKHYVAEFVTEAFQRPVGLYFYSAPPRWPTHFPKVADASETRRIMVEVLRVADLVWPGEIQAE